MIASLLKPALLLALIASCASPNTYATARTVPKGTVAHTIALEGIGALADSQRHPETGESTGGSVFLPAFPAYQARYGLTDDMDIGGRLASLATLGVDFKYNFLRRSTVDLALDPGVQVFRLSGDHGSFGLAYFYLPLLVDVNLSKRVSIVLTPGAMLATSFGAIDDEHRFSAHGVMVRSGVGLNLRISEQFALHPEVTVLKPLERGESPTSFMYAAGVGFNFGSLPVFE